MCHFKSKRELISYGLSICVARVFLGLGFACRLCPLVETHAMIFTPGHQGGHFVTFDGSWRASDKQISLRTQTRVARMMRD